MYLLTMSPNQRMSSPAALQQVNATSTTDAKLEPELQGLVSHEKRQLPLSTPNVLLEHGLIVGLGLLGIVLFLVITLTWRSIVKRKRKAKQLAAMLPKPGPSRPVSYGIRPDQAIEFVVPTINIPETTAFTVTEDSMSDSDCFGMTSGSDRESGGPSRRHRHPAGRYFISPNEINKRLYLDCEQRRKNQMGRVNFVLHYSFYRQQLLVTLLSACELPLSVKKGHVNPFAKVRLLPEKSPKFVTKMQRNNPNPLFNELFIFPAKKASLDNRVLRISVWHYDRFSRKYFVGQVHYQLSESGITSQVDGDVITDEIWSSLKGAGQYASS